MKENNRISLTQILGVLALVIVLITGAGITAEATEGGGGAYPNGAEGFLAGALPPPGFYLINYLAHYTTDALVDSNGDEVTDLDLHANVTVNASRFLYQSDVEFLGGHLGAYTILPLMHFSAESNLANRTKSGLGDITVAPFVSWHFGKNLHMAAAIDITMPTGDYDKSVAFNIGRNYWTIEPVWAVTYLFGNGFDLSGRFGYDFNTENNDTDYTSGQEFHFDYAAGYHWGSWTVGASGYYYKQTTEDELDGEKIDNKGQVFSAGPIVKYDLKTGGFVEFKYMKEMAVENKTEGDKFLCKLVFPF